MRGNFCENRQCNKSYTNNTFTCSNCFKKFCTNTCMVQHVRDIHLVPKDKGKIEELKNEEVYEIDHEKKSPFIKCGSYLEESIVDEDYAMKNFEIKTNQSLGVGTFGDVFVGINKKDGKKYAVKRVKYKMTIFIIRSIRKSLIQMEQIKSRF